MDRARPALHEMLERLIGTPSVSSVSPEFDMSNRAVVEMLAGWLDGLGFRVELQPLADAPDKLNLIATLGSGPGGLVLAGHSDTVPCDPELWASDPFRLSRRDGRLYGLGVSDMKSFFAFAIEAVTRIDARALREPVTLIATCDEESGMAGARALAAARGVHGRWGVIGEPTAMRPVHRHKGIFMDAVRITGRAGHSSDPRLGINAMDVMHRVIAELLVARRELAEQHHDRDFHVPSPTVNLGRIVGGDNPNRICPSCELHFDCRVLPGMDLAATRTALRARLAAIVHGTGAEVAFQALFEGVAALDAVPGSALVELAEHLTTHAADSVAFSTEAPFLRELGIETVVLGPGSIDQAHQPDEWVAESSFEPYVRVLERMIQRCCIEPAAGR